MPFFDFDAARAEVERDRDPITFLLGGETFTCVKTVPLTYMLDFADYDPDTGESVLRASLTYIRKLLLTDEEIERFDALMVRKEDPIAAETIFELMDWLGGQYTGRPLEESKGSSTPSRSTSRPSKRTRSKAAANGSRNSR